MKDIFISYKSEDIEKARKVRDHLEKDGFSVWMAPDSITGGASYAAEIPPAIDGAKVFVLVFTKNTQGSKWVSRELDRAINGNKIIIPLMLDDCELNDEFSFYLTNVHRFLSFRTLGFHVVRGHAPHVIVSYPSFFRKSKQYRQYPGNPCQNCSSCGPDGSIQIQTAVSVFPFTAVQNGLGFLQKNLIGHPFFQRILFQNEYGLLKQLRFRGLYQNHLPGYSFYHKLPLLCLGV